MTPKRVAVPAISFAQHPGLVKLLLERYPGAKVNIEGVPYYRSEQETIDYLRGYDAAIVSFEPINERTLAALPDLKVISKLGVGLDKIDLAIAYRQQAPGIILLAIRVAGIAPDRLIDARLASTGAQGEAMTVGGRSVTLVVGSALSGPTTQEYLYASGDTLFSIRAETDLSKAPPPVPAFVEKAIAALP